MTQEQPPLVVVLTALGDDGTPPEEPAWHEGIPEDATITFVVDPITAEAVRDGIDDNASAPLHTFSSSGEKVLNAREAASLVVGLYRSQQFQGVVLGVRPVAVTNKMIALMTNALWVQVYDGEHKRGVVQVIEETHGADGLVRHMDFYSIGADEVIPLRKGLEVFSEDEDLFVPENWLDES